MDAKQLRLVVLGTLLTGPVGIGACSDDGPLTGPETGPPVASVAVNPPALTLAPGEEFALTARAFDSAGAELSGRAVTWSSSASTVAAVSASGVLSAVRVGNARITAGVEGKSATASVTVATLLVSDPAVSGTFASRVAAPRLRAGSGPDVAYVSLPPGTVPNGEFATVRNLATGNGVSAPILAGGLDPVPIEAAAGDSLKIEIQVTGIDTTVRFALAVPAARRPIVVRTDPPPRKRDVPLNARFIVVFNEPMSAATLTGSTVQLRSGSTTISASIEVLNSGLTAALTADAPLAPNTDYELVVTEGIRDLDGDQLSRAATVTFTTGTGPAGVGSLRLQPASLRLAPGEAIALNAVDSLGQPIEVPVAWTVGNAGVATVSAEGMVTGVSLGATTVTATADGKSTTAEIEVVQLSFASVNAGGHHVCAVTASGAAYCWGGNWAGQLGNGSTSNSSTPIAVAGGLSFRAVEAGASHTCGLTLGDEAYCWGPATWSPNIEGPVGDTSQTVSCGPDQAVTCYTVPVRVGGGLRFTSLSVGKTHACALTAGGAAYCWGNNYFGQLGSGSTADNLAPVAVAGGLTFTQISAGHYLTCGITSVGAAYCWGNNNGAGLWTDPSAGAALGNGSTTGPQTCVVTRLTYYRPSYPCSTVPVAVAGGLLFTAVRAGFGHACGLTSAGSVYCWGGSSSGELGTGTQTGSEVPVSVVGGLTFASIDVGTGDGATTCAVATSGAVYCWGVIYGFSGYFWSRAGNVPEAVPGGLVFAGVTKGWGGLACGLTPAGVAYCWGHGWAGGLGNGSDYGGSSTPVRVAGQ